MLSLLPLMRQGQAGQPNPSQPNARYSHNPDKATLFCISFDRHTSPFGFKVHQIKALRSDSRQLVIPKIKWFSTIGHPKSKHCWWQTAIKWGLKNCRTPHIPYSSLCWFWWSQPGKEDEKGVWGFQKSKILIWTLKIASNCHLLLKA